jgi:hypothetical protein
MFLDRHANDSRLSIVSHSSISLSLRIMTTSVGTWRAHREAREAAERVATQRVVVTEEDAKAEREKNAARIRAGINRTREHYVRVLCGTMSASVVKAIQEQQTLAFTVDQLDRPEYKLYHPYYDVEALQNLIQTSKALRAIALPMFIDQIAELFYPLPTVDDHGGRHVWGQSFMEPSNTDPFYYFIPERLQNAVDFIYGDRPCIIPSSYVRNEGRATFGFLAKQLRLYPVSPWKNKKIVIPPSDRVELEYKTFSIKAANDVYRIPNRAFREAFRSDPEVGPVRSFDNLKVVNRKLGVCDVLRLLLAQFHTVDKFKSLKNKIMAARAIKKKEKEERERGAKLKARETLWSTNLVKAEADVIRYRKNLDAVRKEISEREHRNRFVNGSDDEHIDASNKKRFRVAIALDEQPSFSLHSPMRDDDDDDEPTEIKPKLRRGGPSYASKRPRAPEWARARKKPRVVLSDDEPSESSDDSSDVPNELSDNDDDDDVLDVTHGDDS